MKRDGLDESIMDMDHNKSVKSQLKEAPVPKEDSKEATADDGPPLKDDPEYAKVSDFVISSPKLKDSATHHTFF